MATLLSPEQCGRVPLSILRAWPLTDFEQCTVPITKVRSGGTPKGFLRPYGANPYVGYDSSIFPFLFDGEVPDGIQPLEYVVILGNSAWALDSLREKGCIETDELVLEWMPGRASALDSRKIADGRDLGIVTVSKKIQMETRNWPPIKSALLLSGMPLIQRQRLSARGFE